MVTKEIKSEMMNSLYLGIIRVGLVLTGLITSDKSCILSVSLSVKLELFLIK